MDITTPITVTEAAKRKGVSRFCIINWIRVGKLNPIGRWGGQRQYMLDATEVESIVKGRAGRPRTREVPEHPIR